MVPARRVGRQIENMRTFSSLEQQNGKRHCNIVPAKAQERGGGQTIFFWFGFVVCIVVCFGIKSLEKNQYVQYELYNIIIIAASSRFASITSFVCEYNNLQINYYASKYTKILLLSLSRAFEKVTLIFSNFSMGFTFSSLQRNILLHFAHVIIIVAGRLR